MLLHNIKVDLHGPDVGFIVYGNAVAETGMCFHKSCVETMNFTNILKFLKFNAITMPYKTIQTNLFHLRNQLSIPIVNFRI